MKILSSMLCLTMVINPLWAQISSEADAALHIHVVDDPGPALPQSTSAKGFVVQVSNAAGGPVSGAAVALRLPDSGPTGRFSNGLRAWVAYSDAAGVARFPVIEWGEGAGSAELKVTAAKGDVHAAMIIAQQITTPQPRSISVVSVPVQTPVAAPPLAPPSPPDVQVASPPESLPLADTIPNEIPKMNVAHSGSSAPPEKPHTLKPDPPASSKEDAEPQVSITSSPTGARGLHESHKKLYILLAVGAAAGAGAIVALKGHGSSGSTTSTTGISVGTPTISVGH